MTYNVFGGMLNLAQPTNQMPLLGKMCVSYVCGRTRTLLHLVGKCVCHRAVALFSFY